MSQTSSRKPVQKVLVLVSGLAFIASSIFGVISLFNRAQPGTPQAEDAQSTRVTKLKQQQQGFESVLKREPGNQTALRGIVDIKLALKDYKGAIPYIEKLVKLNPNQPIYKNLLSEVILRSKEKSQN